MRTMNNNEIKNFNEFISNLETLTKKYGIAIQGCDCFIHFDLNDKNQVETLKKFQYEKDFSSGDLMNNLDELREQN